MKLGKIREPLRRLKRRGRTDLVRAVSIAIASAAAAVTAWALAWPLPALRGDVVHAPTALPRSSSDAPPGNPEIEVADLMGRPLFRRDRRPGLPAPPEPEPAAQQKQVEMAANRRATLERYKLSGTVLTKGSRIAIITKAGDPKMLLVREGDDLEGWQVSEIARRIVTLKSGEETAELAFPIPTSPPAVPQLTAAVPAR